MNKIQDSQEMKLPECEIKNKEGRVDFQTYKELKEAVSEGGM